MTIKELYRRALFYLTVPKCVGCDTKLQIDDIALCKRCMRSHTLLKERNCSRCAKTLDKCDCSNEYLKKHKIKRLVKVFRYIPEEEGTPSNNLIYNLKRNNRADVLDFLSNELAKAINNSLVDSQKYIITNVPRRKSEIKRFGYDHAAVLAKAVASLLGAEYKLFLKSKAKKAQKKMSRDERKQNAKVEPVKKLDLHGKKIILLDDIVTSGASMATAADALKALGAKEIIGAAISIAFKDEYTPISNFTYF